MENNILVKLSENININISSDSPDLSELVRKIIEVDDLDVDKITVKSTTENFDKESFEQAIKESIKEIKKELVLNKDNFEKAIKNLQDYK